MTNEHYTIQEKLHILADAAKYDVACTSSGSSRRGQKGELGNAVSCGICHSFAADGRCISLLKILMTNHCVYDCKYCINRASNDVKRATFTPDISKYMMNPCRCSKRRMVLKASQENVIDMTCMYS